MMEQGNAKAAAEQEVRAAVPGLQKRPRRKVHTGIQVIKIVARLAEELDRTQRYRPDHGGGKSGHFQVIYPARSTGLERVVRMTEVDEGPLDADERGESAAEEGRR